MTELFLLALALSALGFIYGFYDLVRDWLKPKVKRMIPKIKESVLKAKKLIPKRKPKRHRIAPYDIVSEVHADHARRKKRYNSLVSRPWGTVSEAQRRRVAVRVGEELSKRGVSSAVAARVQEELRKVENDLFWGQVQEECQRVAGHSDFRSPDPHRGLKKK